MRMIDVHTHILPGMDDGAVDRKEALKLTEELYQQGVGTAVCTPHYLPYRMSVQEFIRNRTDALKQMSESRITLIPASETYLHEYLMYQERLSDLCIEHTRYLVLELPEEDGWKKNQNDLLEQIMIHYDIIPVIAHIERYPYTDSKFICQLIDKGCIIQLNTLSVMEGRSKDKYMKYIRKGLIDVIGSDCHNMTTRRPLMQNAFNMIETRLGVEYCEMLWARSKQMIEGVDIRRY